MDDFLRPLQARKRKAKWAQELVEADDVPTALDSGHGVVTDFDNAQPQSSQLAGQNQERKPVAVPKLTPWKSLKDEHRLLYLTQKGTPLSNKTMPVPWSEVAIALDSQPDSFLSSAGVLKTIENLQARYLGVDQNVHEYFGAAPEPSENRTLRYAEGFDVYDCDVGDSYWTRSSDSIVRPTEFAKATSVADQQAPQPCKKWRNVAYNLRRDGSMITGDALRKSFPSKQRLPESYDEGSDERAHDQVHPDETEQITIQDSQELDGTATQKDTEVFHGRFGSYNSEGGYLRQVLGTFEDTQVEESSELELVAAMRNERPRDLSDVLEQHELEHMLHFSSSPHHHEKTRPDGQDKSDGKKKSEELFVRDSDETESEDEDEGTHEPTAYRPSPVTHTPTECPRKQPGSTRSSKTNGNRSRQFPVHEDPPNTTPRIRKHVAKNPRSPGTDMPKENLRERSPSEEY
ncbi:MAG: hypothetical protein LQ352_006141 [Teloschistes flavicans]|nr:MAG: hypothetical protein LQ352_006141 [Teloschistes flavicans]